MLFKNEYFAILHSEIIMKPLFPRKFINAIFEVLGETFISK